MPLTLAPGDTTSAEGALLRESGRDQSTDSASRDQTRKSGRPDRFVRHRISFIVPVPPKVRPGTESQRRWPEVGLEKTATLTTGCPCTPTIQSGWLGWLPQPTYFRAATTIRSLGLNSFELVFVAYATLAAMIAAEQLIAAVQQ